MRAEGPEMFLFRLFTWPKFVLRVLIAFISLPVIFLWILFLISRDIGEVCLSKDSNGILHYSFKRTRHAIILTGYFLLGGIKSLPLAEEDEPS
jgi:hypothetical protein